MIWLLFVISALSSGHGLFIRGTLASVGSIVGSYTNRHNSSGLSKIHRSHAGFYVRLQMALHPADVVHFAFHHSKDQLICKYSLSLNEKIPQFLMIIQSSTL